MPKEMERRLKAEARSRGYGKERTGAYVYGTMRKTGWRPGESEAPHSSHQVHFEEDRGKKGMGNDSGACHKKMIGR